MKIICNEREKEYIIRLICDSEDCGLDFKCPSRESSMEESCDICKRCANKNIEWKIIGN